MKTMAELDAIREKERFQLNLRHESPDNISIRVGLATCGIKAGAKEVLNTVVDEIEKRKLENVTVTTMGCIGRCRNEPIMEVLVPGQERVTYIDMTPGKAIKVIEEHIINNKVVSEYTIGAR